MKAINVSRTNSKVCRPNTLKLIVYETSRADNKYFPPNALSMSGCNFNGEPGKYQDTVEQPIRGQSSGHVISIDQSEAAAVKYQDTVEHGHVIVLNMTSIVPDMMILI